MNYIYDVLLNFNDKLYEFYDWNKSDDVKQVRRVPIFKISTKQLLDIKNNNVIIDKSFLDLIINKTEYFSNRKVEKIKYSCIFSDGEKSLGVLFNSNGESIKYSSMLIDEESEVNELCSDMKDYLLNININKKNKISDLKTRLDLEKENYVLNELKKLVDNQEDDKIKYIYYDCLNKSESDVNKIVKNIKQSISNPEIVNKFYELLKLSTLNKKI